MRKRIEELSKEAQELARLSENESEPWSESGRPRVDLQKLLGEHPELMKGLNEFVAWREERQRDISESSKPAKVRHEMADAISKLKKTKRKKK